MKPNHHSVRAWFSVLVISFVLALTSESYTSSVLAFDQLPVGSGTVVTNYHISRLAGAGVTVTIGEMVPEPGQPFPSGRVLLTRQATVTNSLPGLIIQELKMFTWNTMLDAAKSPALTSMTNKFTLQLTAVDVNGIQRATIGTDFYFPDLGDVAQVQESIDSMPLVFGGAKDSFLRIPLTSIDNVVSARLTVTDKVTGQTIDHELPFNKAWPWYSPAGVYKAAIRVKDKRWTDSSGYYTGASELQIAYQVATNSNLVGSLLVRTAQGTTNYWDIATGLRTGITDEYRSRFALTGITVAPQAAGNLVTLTVEGPPGEFGQIIRRFGFGPLAVRQLAGNIIFPSSGKTNWTETVLPSTNSLAGPFYNLKF